MTEDCTPQCIWCGLRLTEEEVPAHDCGGLVSGVVRGANLVESGPIDPTPPTWMTGAPDDEPLQISFTPEAARRVRRLKQLGQHPSHAETVRTALRLYEWIVDLQQQGVPLIVGEGDAQQRVTLPHVQGTESK